jgi:hypothetical protein
MVAHIVKTPNPAQIRATLLLFQGCMREAEALAFLKIGV